MIGKDMLFQDGKPYSNWSQLGILFALTTFLFLLQQKYSHSNYIPCLYGLFLTVIFYAWMFLARVEWTRLLDLNVVSEGINLSESLLKLVSDLKFTDTSLSVLWKLKGEILELVMYCLIHLPVNLLSYSACTGVPVSLEKELRTQGISNMLGSLFSFPGYFINCYSIILHQSGFYTVYDGLALSLCYVLLFFTSGLVQSSVPILIQCIFPTLVGLSLCYTGLVDSWKDASLFEYLILVATAAISYFTKIYYGFAFGLFSCFILYFILVPRQKVISEQNRALKPKFPYNHTQNIDYIRIDFSMFFINMLRFRKLVSSITRKIVVIDLLTCFSFDMLGNSVFRQLIQDSTRIFLVIGRPVYANFTEAKVMQNVRLCRNYEQAEYVLDELLDK